MGDKSWVGAVVAGFAVIVSAVMQYLTIRNARHSTNETLRQTETNTRETLKITLHTTRANIRSDNLRHDIDKLTEDLSEYLANSYWFESAYHHSRSTGETWPGEHLDLVKREDLLYNKIRLRLDPHHPLDLKLSQDLEKLRDTGSKELWIARRDHVVDSARSAFAAKWLQVLSD